jgi:hypothetical protein
MGQVGVGATGSSALSPALPPAPWAAGGGGGADMAAWVAARPRAGGDRPTRRPAAGPDHRQGWASTGLGWGCCCRVPPGGQEPPGGLQKRSAKVGALGEGEVFALRLTDLGRRCGDGAALGESRLQRAPWG